jgi:hypothetical protein
MIPDWITAVVASAAFLLSLYSTYTVRREMRLGLIGPRLDAYRKLWKHMDLAAPSRCLEDPTKDIDNIEDNDVKQTLTKEDLETIDRHLRCWYYQEGDGGNGIFLSNKASKIYRTALKAVQDASEDDKASTKAVVTCLSHLRSRTKKDIAVFGRWEE